MNSSPGSIQPARSVFHDILYAQCWEDPTLDRAAFAITPEDRILSITSGGDNVLSFLIDDPREVIALDLNPCQNYLLELKIAAFRTLAWGEMLRFFGVLQANNRLRWYARCRPFLTGDARRFWDTHRHAISRGVIHCGRFERYMRMLGFLARLSTGRQTTERLFSIENAAERALFFDREWTTRRWRLFTRFFLSRRMMTMLFDPAFFAQIEESFSFGDHFSGVLRRAITTLPVHQSWFLSYVLLGRFQMPDVLPTYLRVEHFHAIRNRLNRVRILTGDCLAIFRAMPKDSISRFNFTNIFEWMPPAAYEELLREAVRVASPGAVMTYRNLLVPRSRPETLSSSLVPDTTRAAELHQHDLSFIYRAYVIETVIKRPSCRIPSCASARRQTGESSSTSRTAFTAQTPATFRS